MNTVESGYGEAFAVPPGRAFPLNGVDMAHRLNGRGYEAALAALQQRLRLIQQAYHNTRTAAILVFEGWDASGKGGTISRIASAIDARVAKVWPIAAPGPEERDRHYLARFWERLPAKGTLAIFDRSWYGRVLVERVEELVPPADWGRAYREINDFERAQCEGGTRVIKLFMHVSPVEQLQRLEKRLREPTKRWKLTLEDIRNHKRWDDYVTAIQEMLERTSTATAPWHVIPGDDKKFARIAAISIACDRLEAGIDLSPPPLDKKLLKEVRAAMKKERKDGKG
jgi:polyphosphate kinase 2 (PPK2 family)